MNAIPRHIAIIMDGNGRWAESRGLLRVEGHRKGIETVELITEVCKDFGVEFLTLYAFSDENWERPREEVSALMGLLGQFLKAKREKLVREKIRFITIGETERLPKEVRDEIEATRVATSRDYVITLVVALSYGARTEICRAATKAVESGERVLTPEILEKHLYTTGVPDPDLLIRTSGEIRLSNFLLWQCAYTEFYFTEKSWPDFGRDDLKVAIDDYRRRERRFGKTSAQL